MKTVILSGGMGERLRPLTHEMPKGLIPIRGRTLLDNVVDIFWEYNIFEIWLIIGYKGNQILDKFRACPFIYERAESLGTGGWLNHIPKKYFSTPFFVCNGDNLYDFDLFDMLQEHIREQKRNVVTIALTKVKDVSDKGEVKIKDDRIVRFKEKTGRKRPGWINSGYYIFSPEIFDYLPDKKNISLEKDVFPVLARKGLLGYFKGDGQWFDTGTFENYEKVIKEWRGPRNKRKKNPDMESNPDLEPKKKPQLTES